MAPTNGDSMLIESYLQDTSDISIVLSAATTSAEDKAKVAKAARGLCESLEGPQACIWRVLWGPQAFAALRVALEMQVFEHFDAGTKEQTVEDLAMMIGAEPLLLARIMRALKVFGIFVETGENRYAHNEASMKLTNEVFRTIVKGGNCAFSPYMTQLPSYLASLSFANPVDPKNTLFNYAAKTPLSFYEWLQDHPADLAPFTAAMAATSALDHNGTITTISALFPPATTAEVLLVDVGAGRGLILDDLRAQRPDLQGRMIAQDLEHEIAGRKPNPAIEAMVYDFFTPQPIKGAHMYYLRHVLHNWPDAACTAILRQTVEAMTKGYSRLVVVNQVLPYVGAGLFSAMIDINMMAIAGIQRTERHWRELLDSVGLKVVTVDKGADGRDGFIEAVLAD